MSQGEHGIDEKVQEDRAEQERRMHATQVSDLRDEIARLNAECSGLFEKVEHVEKQRDIALSSLTLALRMRDESNQNLTAVQARCTELLEEVRALKKGQSSALSWSSDPRGLRYEATIPGKVLVLWVHEDLWTWEVWLDAAQDGDDPLHAGHSTDLATAKRLAEEAVR